MPSMKFQLAILVILLAATPHCVASETATEDSSSQEIALPAPRTQGSLSVEEALVKRRSVRSYTDRKFTWEETGQLLWAAQGINRPGTGHRTAPSAGGTYPLEIYAVLPDGVYHYLPERHAVVRTCAGDSHELLAKAGLNQDSTREAACVFIFCAVFERTQVKYGERGRRFVILEAGHTAQNIHLQGIALGIGSVPIGGSVDADVQKALDIPEDQQPVYVIAAGFPDSSE